MAMLHLALAQLSAQQLVVLTVDHGLRDGSRAEAESVARHCAELGVAHHILTWAGKKPRSAIQARARTVRYDLMATWCREHGVDTLLTGHTMDDQAETVAMRLQRTSSPKSLAAIWPDMTWQGVRVLRPLLGLRRGALRQYLRSAGVSWLEDPSNANARFERVRVRQNMPSEDVALLAAQADTARRATLVMVQAAQEFLKTAATLSPFGMIIVARQPLLTVDVLIAGEALSRILAIASGGTMPDAGGVLRLVKRLQSGAQFRATLGGSVIAARSREVCVGREASRIARGMPVIGPTGRLLWDGRFGLEAPPGSSVQTAGHAIPLPKGWSGKPLPAFVRATLPMVVLPTGKVVVPHFEVVSGVSVTIGEGFCL